MGRKNRNARKQAPMLDEPLAPPAEQLANGHWQRDYVLDENTGLKALAYRNTGHDPVARWLASNKLDQRQKAAIDTVRRLWDVVGIRQKITASYGERTGNGGCVELRANLVLDAMKDLERIEGYFHGLRQWWSVFENCCRFGEPAGQAGMAVGYAPKTAQTRALTTVQFIADIIADRERI